MRDSAVASRYAQALYLVTERRGESDRALEDLRGLGAIAMPHSRTGQMLAGPLVLLSDKRAVFQKVLEGKALPAVVLFADLLLRKHRFDELPGIVEQFEALVEKKHGIHRATVTSAVPLTAGPVTLTEAVDPLLVGGANVRIGDRLIDRTVKTLLEAIEHQLYQTSV